MEKMKFRIQTLVMIILFAFLISWQRNSLANCNTDSDCSKDHVCINGACKEGCVSYANCKAGKVCRGYVWGIPGVLPTQIWRAKHYGKCYNASGTGTVAGDPGTLCVLDSDCWSQKCDGSVCPWKHAASCCQPGKCK